MSGEGGLILFLSSLEFFKFESWWVVLASSVSICGLSDVDGEIWYDFFFFFFFGVLDPSWLSVRFHLLY